MTRPYLLKQHDDKNFAGPYSLIFMGKLFRTSSLAKGVLLAILVELSLGKGMLFGKFGQRNVKIR